MTRSWFVAGIAAGLVSGILLVAFAAFEDARTGQPASATYTYLATALGGSTLGEGAAAVPIGVAALFAGTLLWSFGYLYAARRQPQLLTRPLISGAVFGIIVWLVMQSELALVGRFSPPTTYTFDRDMVAFILFFGMPLAFTASRVLHAK